MKKWIFLGWILGAVPLWAQNSGQVSLNLNLPSVSLVDVEPGGDITLSLNNPTEAGMAATGTANNTKWLNFTSSVVAGSNRRIVACISSGTVASGIGLRMYVNNYSGNGAGSLGFRISSILLNNTDQTIITNIGGAYTGNGPNNGYQLTYALEIQNYSQLRHEAYSNLSITFTLMDY